MTLLLPKIKKGGSCLVGGVPVAMVMAEMAERICLLMQLWCVYKINKWS